MTKLTVTIEDVTAAIVSETYTVLPDWRTTICQLTLKNGFTVDGHSACVSIENFNAEIGNKYAREEAVKKVWAYLGWDLATKTKMIKDAGEATGMILKVGSPTTYVGTKVVRALPMDRLTYHDLRGWNLPGDDTGNIPGYLVEYVDGGGTNVDGFAGYISWSPKDVFDRAYGHGTNVAPTTYADRLRTEYYDLSEKATKLSSFLGSNLYLTLPTEDQHDLQAQYAHMYGYKLVLQKRVERL